MNKLSKLENFKIWAKVNLDEIVFFMGMALVFLFMTLMEQLLIQAIEQHMMHREILTYLHGDRKTQKSTF